MTAQSPKQPATVADFCRLMETIAPTSLAQEWDNVGLLAGDPSAPLRKLLLCIDLTPEVVEEAVAERSNLVLAYHPPIFRPIHSLRADSRTPDAAVFRCIAHGIAIYSTHTALDAADGGTNDVIAGFCGVTHTEPLETVDEPGSTRCKLVVFVPRDQVEDVAQAMFAAGAGCIGGYSQCSYRVSGQGTFLGGESTHPTIGNTGRLEFVGETRLEVVVPNDRLAAVVRAMIDAHSYEEPAYDIYPLKPKPVGGIGRWGDLPAPIALAELARKIKKAVQAPTVQVIGSWEHEVSRAIIVVGAAGSLPFRMNPGRGDVVITGEIRHHDALTMSRNGCTAIALGHWTSERPVLRSLAARVRDVLSVEPRLSHADREPFGFI